MCCPQHKAQGAETTRERGWVRVMGHEKEPHVPVTWPVHTQLTKDTLKEEGDRAVPQRDKGDLDSSIPG